MPKPLRYENNNTAIPWLVPRDERIKLDHTDQIFQRWEFDFDLEHHNFLLTLVQEDSYINDSDEKKSVNQNLQMDLKVKYLILLESKSIIYLMKEELRTELVEVQFKFQRILFLMLIQEYWIQAEKQF